MLLYSGDLRLNDETGRVTVGAEMVRLTETEFLMLRAILSRKGHTVPAEDIVTSAFMNGASDGALKAHMCNLRRKIKPHKIAAVYGVGYRIEAAPFFVTEGRR